MFSSCPYSHLGPIFPQRLTKVVPGTMHAMVAEITAIPREQDSSSVYVLNEPRYTAYGDFIQHYNPLELRMNRLSSRKIDE